MKRITMENVLKKCARSKLIDDFMKKFDNYGSVEVKRCHVTILGHRQEENIALVSAQDGKIRKYQFENGTPSQY